MFGNLKVADERKEVWRCPPEVQGRCVELQLVSFQVAVNKESFLSSLVKEAEVVCCEEVGELVSRVIVFVQVVVLGPDGVVEIEVSEEYGVRVEGLDGLHSFNSRVVDVVVDVEDEERMGGGDFKAHDVGSVDDVRSELACPFGTFGGYVHHHVGTAVLAGVLGENGLPVLVLGAAVEVIDRIALGHLRIGPNSSEVRFLN